MRRPADLVLVAALAAFLIVGGLLVRSRPRLAWLLIAEGALWEVGILSDAWLYHGGPNVLQTILDWIWIPALAGVPVIGVVAFRAVREEREPRQFAVAGSVGTVLAGAGLERRGRRESTTHYFNVA